MSRRPSGEQDRKDIMHDIPRLVRRDKPLSVSAQPARIPSVNDIERSVVTRAKGFPQPPFRGGIVW
jgi:hypothetical protein